MHNGLLELSNDSLFISAILPSLLQVTYGMVQYDYFVCPVEYNLRKDAETCIRNPVFVVAEYSLPLAVRSFLSLVSGRHVS